MVRFQYAPYYNSRYFTFQFKEINLSLLNGLKTRSLTANLIIFCCTRDFKANYGSPKYVSGNALRYYYDIWHFAWLRWKGIVSIFCTVNILLNNYLLMWNVKSKAWKRRTSIERKIVVHEWPERKLVQETSKKTKSQCFSTATAIGVKECEYHIDVHLHRIVN